MSLTNENYENARNEYNRLADQYTSGAMYDKARQMASTGAQQQAVNAGAQAQGAARNAGLTKAQAATMGASQAADTYNNALANQYNAAAQSLGQGLGAKGQVMGTESGQESSGQKWLNAGLGAGQALVGSLL